MRYLLDTCLVLWVLEDNKKRLKSFGKILDDPTHEFVVSVVSCWEITIKKNLGKLEIPDDWIDCVEETGMSWLPLEPQHIKVLATLPPIHQDSFDRLLISQSLAEQLTLLTADDKILQYFN